MLLYGRNPNCLFIGQTSFVMLRISFVIILSSTLHSDDVSATGLKSLVVVGHFVFGIGTILACFH